MLAPFRIGRALLISAAVSLIPFYAMADQIDPIIVISPSIPSDIGLNFVFSPLSDLSFSFQVTTPSFVDVATTGGGSVQFSAPQFSFITGPSPIGPATILSIDNVYGTIQTFGPGTASVHSGETVSFAVTNISSNTDTLIAQYGYGFTYVAEFLNRTTGGFLFNIPQGEQLTANVGFELAGPEVGGLNGSLGVNFLESCPPPNPGSFSCHLGLVDLTGSGLGIYHTIDPGQTLNYTLTLDVTYSVTEVPEPSSLLLLASMFGLGFFPLRRAGKAPH
jgi:hypothetical protein